MAIAALASPQAALLHPPHTTRHLQPPLRLSCHLPPLPPSRLSLHSRRRLRLPIVAEATSGSGRNGLDDLAASFMDSARSFGEKAGHALETARLRAMEFVEARDLQGTLKQAFTTANAKFEEWSYEVRKNAEKMVRRYKISQKAQEIVDFANEQVKNVDQQFGVVQKVRTASSDFSRNWPMYRRQLDKFLQTPLGKMFTTLVFLWFLLSGWLFRIIFLTMWVLPFAAPLLISTAARNVVVEGACPSCKRRFIGSRNQMVVCNYCKAVIWQPRQDFSRDKSDPSIIDIDVD